MVEILNGPLPTTAIAPDDRNPVHQPQGLGDRFRATASRVGNNIDLINLYARQKDWYKMFEVAGAVGARFFAHAGAKMFGVLHKPVEELEALKNTAIRTNSVGKLEEYYSAIAKEEAHGKKIAGLTADTMNTALQLGISGFSTWWEKETLVRVYEKALQQELGKDVITYKDLSHSKNPIIKNAADYYDRKAMWRMAPDFLGLIKWVPALSKKMGGEAGPLYKATQWIEKSDFSGIDLALGGKTAYFLWYFIERQTGGHYALLRIWNKTEGVKEEHNRLVNQNVHPGELVTQEEITGLYREVAQDRKLRDFTTDDPLTGRIFEQVARYLNHDYVPQIYKVKRPNVNHDELEGSNFTHADLVNFFGTAGIDINDAYASALRLEVLARKGRQEYLQLNERIGQLKRPLDVNAPAFPEAMLHYMDQLDQAGKAVLGDTWPTTYIREEIRPGIMESYHITPPVPVQQRFSGPEGKKKPAVTPDTIKEIALEALAKQTPETPGTVADLVEKTPTNFRERHVPQERIPAQKESHADRARESQAAAAHAAATLH